MIKLNGIRGDHYWVVKLVHIKVHLWLLLPHN